MRPPIHPQELTAMEEETLDEFAWLSPTELYELSKVETVYPQSLPEHVANWSKHWDGVVVELAPEGGGWVHEGP